MLSFVHLHFVLHDLQLISHYFSAPRCQVRWKLGYLRWPTSATAKLTFPRQNLLFHGKTFFSTAKLTFSRQNLLFHGKTYFSTAKLFFPRQNLLFHGKTYFSTAKLTFPRQNLLSHGKTYFSTAKLTFLRQNLLSHGKTYFSTAKLTFPFLASSLSLPMLSRVGDPGIFSRAIWRMAKKIMCE